MEGAGDRVEGVLGVRELVDLRDPGALGRRQQEPVVRSDEEASRRVREGDRAPYPAHARVDDRQVHARGHVRERAREDVGALQHLRCRDAVRDVDDASVRRDLGDNPVAGPDEVVPETEVAQEADHHSRPSLRRGDRTLDRLQEAVEVARHGLGRDGQPRPLGRSRRLGTDGDDGSQAIETAQ